MFFKINKIFFLILIYQFILFETGYSLRNSLFGSNLYGTAAKLFSQSQKSLRKTDDKKDENIELTQESNKVTLEVLNSNIKEILQKEASNSGLGTCLLDGDLYMNLGLRETNYSKCTKLLSLFETWFNESIINSEMKDLMLKNNLSIPSNSKLKIPGLEVIFKETFAQICTTFFVTNVNEGKLFLNNVLCTGIVCHEQLNNVCNSLTEKYGKSAFVLGSTCISDTIKKICQESRRQLVSKYPTLIASPADIRLDNKPIEATDPIPT